MDNLKCMGILIPKIVYFELFNKCSRNIAHALYAFLSKGSTIVHTIFYPSFATGNFKYVSESAVSHFSLGYKDSKNVKSKTNKRTVLSSIHLCKFYCNIK